MSVHCGSGTRLRIYRSALRDVKYVYGDPVPFTGHEDHLRHAAARDAYMEARPRTQFNVG